MIETELFDITFVVIGEENKEILNVLHNAQTNAMHMSIAKHLCKKYNVGAEVRSLQDVDMGTFVGFINTDGEAIRRIS